MKARPTIMLSGVSRELGTFRDAVAAELQIKGCFPENQPTFPPDHREVAAMLRRKITDADAVVHIVGFRFGAEPGQRPPGAPRRSYTQMEFDIARELQKPVYVFLSKDAAVRDAPEPDEQPEDAEAVALQLAHREVIQQGDHLYYWFGDAAELCRLVAEIPPVQAAQFFADIARIDRYAPERLIGREAETQLLEDAWAGVRSAAEKRPRVLTFVALGGEGKTSLVAKWAADLAHRGWPGCEAAYAWSFYSQGTREQVAASSDLFLKDALTAFGDPEMANSAQSSLEKGRRLAELVGQRRALLILDGLEPLQYAPTSPMAGALKDQGVAALLKKLSANSQGLCVVTTRYSIPDLRGYRETTAPEHALVRLSTEAGVALLRSFDVKGTPQECETLVEDVKGHALTLNLLGAWLRDAYAGDIRKRDLVKFTEADEEEQGGHAFRVMDAYSRWLQLEERGGGGRALALLRLLGFFDRPLTAGCLGALLEAPAIGGLTEQLVGMPEAQCNVTLARLERARLLTIHRDRAGKLLSLDAHPLLREYFSARIRKQEEEGWREGHRRLYEHLCEQTKEGDQPDLEALQPLYQAVAHGCHAGLQREARERVYRDRIQRGNETYSTQKLGAHGSDLGAVTCFFDQPWSRVSPALTDVAVGWLLNEAAFSLRALGRLTEAKEPMRSGLEVAAKHEHWDNASISASNLSELELTLGEVAGAVSDAEQSVTYADRSGDRSWSFLTRTTLGDALHQSGRRDEAAILFREAEAMQGREWPNAPLFYALQGFRYCDLLLSESERGAWRRSIDQSCSVQPSLLEPCHGVSQRATKTMKIARRNYWLLAIALDNLTLGRAALYQSVLQGTPLAPGDQLLQFAVRDLRRAGQQDYIPRGLLTRAWLRALTDTTSGPDSAEADLNEAFEIAERGPMPLYLADVHLHRARLFFRKSAYPWQSPEHDLAEARRLIEKHGYGRRLPELEDAEAVILRGETL